MRRISNNDGIAPWKIDHPMEKLLARMADISWFGKCLYVGFYKLFDRDYYQKGLKIINRNVETFVGKVSSKQLQNYVIDMVYSLHRFGCMFDEYFFYDFQKLNIRGREAFITDKRRWDYYAKMNLDENKELFNNKRKAYELFKKYYQRELIEILEDADQEKFAGFVNRHDRYIVKPIAGSGGKGVYVTSLASDNVDSAFVNIRGNGPVVVEELIEQESRMKALHPESLNTIRIPTIV